MAYIKYHIIYHVSIQTSAVQPVATCRQSPYLHKPATVIVTSFSLWRLAPTALAAPVVIMTSFATITAYVRYGHISAFTI